MALPLETPRPGVLRWLGVLTLLVLTLEIIGLHSITTEELFAWESNIISVAHISLARRLSST